MSTPVKDELVSFAWLMSADAAQLHASGLETSLARFGFAVCTDKAKAMAESDRIRLVFAHSPSGDFGLTSIPAAAFLPKEILRFFVGPYQAHAAALAEGFDAALALPVDERALVGAFATCRYVAVSASEHQSLYARIREAVCDDDTVARRVIRLLIDTNRSTLAELRDAVSTTSWDAVGRNAHRLAGSARMLDCLGLLAFLSRLEDAARARQQALAQSVLQVVANTVDNLDALLQRLLHAA